MSKRKRARIRKGRSTSKIRSKAAAAGSPTITKREQIRAPLRRNGARSSSLAQARPYDGGRRNGDQRAGQGLSVHGAPAGRRSHTPLTPVPRVLWALVAKVVPVDRTRTYCPAELF
jgi:hypothetical protein